ncbi:hypothetical protein VBK25_14910 [Enterobacter hormaechei]|nr:hypothetical protein [Enterobacter hormaechei]MEA3817618.1 hypothetical protein [Enterobacter hormaechei]
MHQNLNSEEISIYGYVINKRFANRLVDTFSPAIVHVVEKLVIEGKDERTVTEAATTTARAIVAGIRELVKNHNSNHHSNHSVSHAEKEAQMDSIQQDQQTKPLVVEPQVETQVHRTPHQSDSGNE